MEKNVKTGQKFMPGEPNTFKNGSFCYLIFSKKFSLPISEKKFIEIHWSNMTEKSTKSEFWPHQVTIFQKSLKLKNEGLW